jgi:signal peptide peptidase SppA
MIENQESKKITSTDDSTIIQPERSWIKTLLSVFCCNSKPTVNVLRLAGVITDSSGAFSQGLSLEALDEQITKAFKGKNTKAVALQINSPGGSPVQSELIANRIIELSAEKEIPVISFIEDAGASGGYWLSCAGDEIFASRNSIVGSIGVIAAGFGFVKAIEKIGVERRIYTQGENKSILDPFKEEKNSDIAIVHNLQKNIHDNFKNMVRERREGKIDSDSEKHIFSGEFWTGETAKELGLIDEIGTLHQVLKDRYGKDIKINRINKAKGFMQKIMNSNIADSFVRSFFSRINEQVQWNKLGL